MKKKNCVYQKCLRKTKKINLPIFKAISSSSVTLLLLRHFLYYSIVQQCRTSVYSATAPVVPQFYYLSTPVPSPKYYSTSSTKVLQCNHTTLLQCDHSTVRPYYSTTVPQYHITSSATGIKYHNTSIAKVVPEDLLGQSVCLNILLVNLIQTTIAGEPFL